MVLLLLSGLFPFPETIKTEHNWNPTYLVDQCIIPESKYSTYLSILILSSFLLYFVLFLSSVLVNPFTQASVIYVGFIPTLSFSHKSMFTTSFIVPLSMILGKIIYVCSLGKICLHRLDCLLVKKQKMNFGFLTLLTVSS